MNPIKAGLSSGTWSPPAPEVHLSRGTRRSGEAPIPTSPRWVTQLCRTAKQPLARRLLLVTWNWQRSGFLRPGDGCTGVFREPYVQKPQREPLQLFKHRSYCTSLTVYCLALQSLSKRSSSFAPPFPISEHAPLLTCVDQTLCWCVIFLCVSQEQPQAHPAHSRKKKKR